MNASHIHTYINKFRGCGSSRQLTLTKKECPRVREKTLLYVKTLENAENRVCRLLYINEGQQQKKSFKSNIYYIEPPVLANPLKSFVPGFVPGMSLMSAKSDSFGTFMSLRPGNRGTK